MRSISIAPKKISQLTANELKVFKQWIGHEPGGGEIGYPTLEEKRERHRRERWKRRYAGKGSPEPKLLVRAEQLRCLRKNTRTRTAARKWQEQLFKEADEVAGLGKDFWQEFISELGPWNCRGNYCPHCIGKKSGECLNRYFWDWDWRDPDRLKCPHCGHVFPDSRYPEKGVLELPRLKKRYTFYLRPEELAAEDWRLGEHAAHYAGEPVHVSFTGNIRAMKLGWALEKATPLSLAFAISGKKKYARCLQRIFERMAEVYPGYALHSYLQDMVDADPGYAVEHADELPTVFKRNPCITAYESAMDGFFHGDTTTETTKVASGLWGASRIAPEMTATADAFLSLFQAYDLVKKAIPEKDRVRIEQDFLLEFYLDVKAYTPITNKSGGVRAARVAFGLVYDHAKELKAGLAGFHAIVDGQFYLDGSMKEAPVYAHKPIGDGLWKIPEMVRGHTDLYADSLYAKGLQTLVDISTPAGLFPPLDDSYVTARLSPLTADIARVRCGIVGPDPLRVPSEFAILNTDLSAVVRRRSRKVLNRFYADRRLVCLGMGAGSDRSQLYLSGADGRVIHRHHDALNLQLFVGGWDVFPDLGYLWDHPGKQWATSTPAHFTVTVDEQNSRPAQPSELWEYVDSGSTRMVAMQTCLESGAVLRRRVTLIKKTDGRFLLTDEFEVEGGKIHDYNVRVNVPAVIPGIPNDTQASQTLFIPQASQDYYLAPVRKSRPASFSLEPVMRECKGHLYQEHSHYPLRNFRTAGGVKGGWQATWKRGGRSVLARVETPCDEVITYQSPAWRSQMAVAAEPNDYADALLLRNCGPKSRFKVVYDIRGR